MNIKNKKFCLMFFLTACLASACVASPKADLVIFSFDRPLQLYTLLASTDKYFSNLNKTFVLCRASDQAFVDAYQEVNDIFSHVHFVKQGSEPKKDFKPLLLQCFDGSDADYILFAIDDDIVTDYADINTCVSALEDTGAHGFYLRLGMNINYSYIHGKSLTLPPLQEVTKGIYTFRFQDGQASWGYPNNVDMTIFKKSDIESAFKNGRYHSPNTLESIFSRQADRSKFGLCFEFSKKMNIPLNLVQEDWHNKHEDLFSAQELLDKWREGLTIDFEQCYQIKNSSCFVPYVPTFVQRDSLILSN